MIDAVMEGLLRIRWDFATYVLLVVLWISVSTKLDTIIVELKKLNKKGDEK